MKRERIDFTKLQENLGYWFNDLTLLQQALTHKSYGRLIGRENNERLEFLGDAVLQLVVSHHLYQNYPGLREGQLAKIRALLVSQPTLAQQARKLELNRYLKVGKGEERTRARERDSLLCDTLEAVFGAVYLDSDFEQVRPVILEHLPAWDQKQLSFVDAKSTLQEHLQQTTHSIPEYVLTEEQGPDHDKMFLVEVRFHDEVLGKGRGKSKKEAAQQAAREALDNLNIQFPADQE